MTFVGFSGTLSKISPVSRSRCASGGHPAVPRVCPEFDKPSQEAHEV